MDLALPFDDGRNFNWLRDNPDFDQRPATIRQFLGPGYLDIDRALNPNLPPKTGIRPGVKQCLVDIFGEDVNPARIAAMQRALMTGGIGIGKSTMASVALPYMLHWVGCLHDPQAFYGLLPGSKIAFMLMSTTAIQAREVLFGDIKSRLNQSPWFRDNFEYNTDDKNLKNKLKFPREIWLLPGGSKETQFEGYNILGGVIDEADSHQVTEHKDYAEAGYNTIENRIKSRYEDRGLLIVIGQKKSAGGFIARKQVDMEKDEHATVTVMTIWESRGWDYYRNDRGELHTFFYDKARKKFVPNAIAKEIADGNPTIIEIPEVLRKDFENDPVKALRDYAGDPPEVESPFITLPDRIDSCMDRWEQSHSMLMVDGKVPPPVNDNVLSPQFADHLYATDSLKRVIHCDIAYSGAKTADALGMAMGHVSHLVDLDGEVKPYIVFDFLLRMKAPPGGEVILSDVRRLIYELRNERKFKVGWVSFDGVQSLDTIQTLRKQRFNADYLSVDKSKMPYEDLKESIYERRCEFPEYYTYRQFGSADRILIAKSELTQLIDDGKKIDHAPHGSKDVADAMAGVVHVLMGLPSMRRGARKRAPVIDLAEHDYTEYDPTEHRSFDPSTAQVIEGLDFAAGQPRELGPGRGPAPRAPRGMPQYGSDPFSELRARREP